LILVCNGSFGAASLTGRSTPEKESYGWRPASRRDFAREMVASALPGLARPMQVQGACLESPSSRQDFALQIRLLTRSERTLAHDFPDEHGVGWPITT